MNTSSLKSAVQLAERFLQVAKEAEPYIGKHGVICGTRKTGELRRVSLDLTRALADLRRPN